MSSNKYPDKAAIQTLFANLASGNADAFFSRVSPDVEWDVLGTHPCAGHFTNLADWKAGALGPINKVLREPLALKVRNVVGGGDEEWAVVELFADATCKDGKKPRFLAHCLPYPLVKLADS